MIRTSIFVACALVALMSPLESVAQNPPPGFYDNEDKPKGQIALVTMSFKPGLNLRFETIAEPPLEKRGSIGVIARPDGNVIHRLIIDEARQQYFGYDMTAEVMADGRFSVSFSILSVGPEVFASLRAEGPLYPALPSKYPDPQYVESGDRIALDLFVSSDRKQKIVDYIGFSSQGPQAEPPVPTSTGEPKDFTVDDGPVKLARADLWINGQRFARHTFGNGRNEGATMWLYVPGQGRYVLSLVPHEGFNKLGVIRGNVISFQADGQQYEIRAYTPIVGSGGTWNLYILHDPSYRWIPSNTLPPGTPFIGLGVSRLDNLLPKP